MIHSAPRLGMRYPARVVSVLPFGLSLHLDVSGAPGAAALLMFGRSVETEYARTLAVEQRTEVVLIEVNSWNWLVASLPADPEWLTWNNGTVRQLALRIRQSGETVLIPVLGDALEDAGCTDRTLLNYLRQGPTEEPNWVVELLATQE